MPHSFANLAIHVVFSTASRKPWLQDASMREQLYAYMASVIREQVDSPAILINGVEDHVHLLLSLSRKHPIMKVVQVAKTETSKWLKGQPGVPGHFAWQGGYSAFSVSQSNIPQVKLYIENQEEHHRRISFQDEFRALCKNTASNSTKKTAGHSTSHHSDSPPGA